MELLYDLIRRKERFYHQMEVSYYDKLDKYSAVLKFYRILRHLISVRFLIKDFHLNPFTEENDLMFPVVCISLYITALF